MEKQSIPVAELALQPFTAFGTEGVLLVSGQDPFTANVMTISWGMFGIMWGRPIMMAMVRHSRHTWEIIRQAEDFTVNWMPEDWTDAVRLCGRKSGRDLNKFEATGLAPVSAEAVKSPVIAQSELTLECRTLYRTDLNPDQFIDQAVLNSYGDGDFHELFFGEVVSATGLEKFRRA